MPAGRHQRLSPARLPTHLGDLALRSEPRPRVLEVARRVEIRADGDALRAHQRGGGGGHHQPPSWGNSRGKRNRQTEVCLNDKGLLQHTLAFGKGEVESSILSGSTI